MFPGAISTKELEANFEEYKDKNLIAYWYHARSLHKPICSFCKQFSGRVPVGKQNTSMLATAQLSYTLVHKTLADYPFV
jgi:hypothetical protein